MKWPLTLPPGLSSDDTTFSTEGRWSGGNNMRFWRERPQTVGGCALAIDGIDGVCRAVLPWTDVAGISIVAFASHTQLSVYYGGTLYDITPASGFTPGAENGAGGPGFGAGAYGEGGYGEASLDDYFPLTWSLGNWGENLLASPRRQTLFIWENDPMTAATEVTDAPDDIVCMLVTPERQVLVGGCNEFSGGAFNPLLIRASNLRDYSDWDPSVLGTSAFEYPLAGSGRIVGMKQVGSYVGIWTDSALYIGEFVGTVDQVYRFDKVADHCGLCGPNAVQVIGQTAYWITPDYQVYAWTPGSAPQPVEFPIRGDFKNNIAFGQYDKIAACSISQFGEVWWHYPDARDGTECSRYIALSTLGNGWFKGQLARSACIDAGPLEYPIFVSPGGTAYWHENGNSLNGEPLAWSLSTSDLYMDDAANVMRIDGIWPDFEQQIGPVSMELEARFWPQSNARDKGPYSLSANRAKYDFRATGRIFNITFSGESSPAFVRFGKPLFDVSVDADR